jgi:hypothetical protein
LAVTLDFEALERLAGEIEPPPMVILSDINMPVMVLLELLHACAGALQHRDASGQDRGSQGAEDDQGRGRHGAIPRTSAHCDDSTGSWQARRADSRGSGPRLGKWQDATGNRRCLQRSSPKPCRRRYC